MNFHFKRPYSTRFKPARDGTISSRVSDEARSLLAQVALSRGMSLSEYLCRLVNEHLQVVTGLKGQP